MRTLDEAIKHEEKIVADNEKFCKVAPNNCAEAYHCAEEHRQLAEWLKELKELKQTNTAESPCKTCPQDCDTTCDIYNEWLIGKEPTFDDTKYEERRGRE